MQNADVQFLSVYGGTLPATDVDRQRYRTALTTLVEAVKIAPKYMAVMDKVMVLLTDYLAGELDEDGVRFVESLLTDIPAFRAWAGPVIAAWRAPDPQPPVSDADVDVALANFQARLAARRK